MSSSEFGGRPREFARGNADEGGLGRGPALDLKRGGRVDRCGRLSGSRRPPLAVLPGCANEDRAKLTGRPSAKRPLIDARTLYSPSLIDRVTLFSYLLGSPPIESVK
jgi:hypothetical protein